MKFPNARLLRDYLDFLRQEPRARAYVAGSIIDDVGTAASAWASTLMFTNLMASQRQRASLMLPSLVCFFIGALVSGPLADWAARSSALQLARWRWKIVVLGRVLETVFLAILVFQLAREAVSIRLILPFMMVRALMKTGLRPARLAFSLDLLCQESPQHSASGEPLKDERGDPLLYKKHLVSFTAMVSFFAAAGALAGLLLGNRILGAVQGRSWILFGFDVLTNLGFIAVILWRCHPDKPAREVRLRDLFTRAARTLEIARASGEQPAHEGGFRHFWRSFAEGFRFLAQPAQRPLLALMLGALIVETVSETYDGRMIVKHVLHGGDEGVRHGHILWEITGVFAALALPLVVRRVGAIGKIFLATMLLDGLVIAFAGRIAGAGAAFAVTPFVATLCFDHCLTLASSTLTEVAQNSISSAAMRGRIAGSYALVVIVADMGAEGVATMASERWGIPGMLVRVGFAQFAVVALIALWGGRQLWRFGLRADDAPAAGVEPVEQLAS